MKILYILNVAPKINSFCISSILAAKQLGIEFHIAGNWGYHNELEKERDEKEYGITIHQIDFQRFPLKLRNIEAYRQLKQLLQKEKFDVIHCNTPIGGILGRIVAKSYKIKHVIYQAHGFHFYKGAPIKNWILYYPVEKWLSHCTDILITINQEDYKFAQKRMQAKQVVYIPGVGIDLNKFEYINVDQDKKRQEIGIPNDVFLLLSVGELNKNKNHETVIRAIADIPNLYYIIAGEGDLHDYLQKLIGDLNVSNRVKLLGYRKDICELYKISDIYVMPSFREGLSVALMEAMASELPCVVSGIRGNTDLIDNNGGALFDPHSVKGCACAIKELLERDLISVGTYNAKKIRRFSLDNVSHLIQEVYEGAIERQKKA